MQPEVNILRPLETSASEATRAGWDTDRDLISNSGHPFGITFFCLSADFHALKDQKATKLFFFFCTTFFRKEIKSSVSTSYEREREASAAPQSTPTTQHNQATKQVVLAASCASGYKWPLVFCFFFFCESAGELCRGWSLKIMPSRPACLSFFI